MRRTARVIEVLLAGPSDVKKEIGIVREEISAWNAAHSGPQKVVLQAINWDTHSFPAIGDRPQGIINRQIVDRCDLLIAIFWKTLGSSTGLAASGTVEEIERFRKSGRPAMIYFSERAIPQKSSTADWERLQRYRSELSETLYSTFTSAAELRKKVSRHLSQAVNQLLNEHSPTREARFSDDWLSKQAARLNRIEVELNTTHIVNDLPKVVEQLKPVLLDCCGHVRFGRVRDVRDNIQSLMWRVGSLKGFRFNSGTFEEFDTQKERLFTDIRKALGQLSVVGKLSDWEITQYEALRTRYREHNTESAMNWPEEKQCQCSECEAFRRHRAELGVDLNPAFRAFVGRFKEKAEQLLEGKATDKALSDDWMAQQREELRDFEARFSANDQLQNAKLAADAAESLVLPSLLDRADVIFDGDPSGGLFSRIRDVSLRLQTAANPFKR